MNQSSKVINTLRNPHLWLICVLMVLLTINYYADSIGISSWVPFWDEFFGRDYIHDMHRALFLIPMLYTAALFHMRAAVIVSIIVLGIVLPRALYISPFPDAIPRALVFIGVASLATVLLGQAQKNRLRQKVEHDFSSTLIDQSGALVMLLDMEGRITSFNRACQEITGYSLGEVKGKFIWDILTPPEEKDLCRTTLNITAGSQSPIRHDHHWVTKDRDRRFITWTSKTILNPNGPSDSFLYTGIDITEQALAQKTQLEYTSIVEWSDDAIIGETLDGIITNWNPGAEKLYGYTGQEVIGKHISILVPPGKPDDANQILERIQRGEVVHHYETKRIKKDGNFVDVSVTVSPIKDMTGKLLGASAIARDITERKLAEEQLRKYAELVTQAQEEERKRIARELHDETTQDLAALGFDVDILINSAQGLPRNTIDEMESIRERIERVLRGVQRHSQDLRPPVLEDFGLVSALESLTESISERNELEVSLNISGIQRRLSPNTELVLFRIVQEALSNARRHSGATRVTVRLEFNIKKVMLNVTDNGEGIGMPNALGDFARQGKLGILGMRERAQLINAIFSINSNPGKGTTVRVDVSE
ncbi:PAS domain S-box protein [Chloroflexota bacterium]